VNWQSQLQNPLVIGLSLLFCWPAGLVLVGIHPRVTRKTKRIVFGCLAALIVIAIIFGGLVSSIAHKQVLQANALWETGKHEEAVAIYERLVAGKNGGILPDSMKPTVYGRLIDHEASSGNVAGATKWIEQAARFKIAPDVLSQEAQRILSSREEERRRREQLAKTKTETKQPAADDKSHSSSQSITYLRVDAVEAKSLLTDFPLSWKSMSKGKEMEWTGEMAIRGGQGIMVKLLSYDDHLVQCQTAVMGPGNDLTEVFARAVKSVGPEMTGWSGCND